MQPSSQRSCQIALKEASDRIESISERIEELEGVNRDLSFQTRNLHGEISSLRIAAQSQKETHHREIHGLRKAVRCIRRRQDEEENQRNKDISSLRSIIDEKINRGIVDALEENRLKSEINIEIPASPPQGIHTTGVTENHSAAEMHTELPPQGVTVVEVNESHSTVNIASPTSASRAVPPNYDGEAYNTGTLHMYAISKILNRSAKWWHKLLASLVSLTLVTMQSTILYTFYWEPFFTPCVVHTDCQDGTYCDYDSTSTNGFCVDCGSRGSDLNETLCSALLDEENLDNEDFDAVFFKDSLNLKKQMDITEWNCTINSHCKNTDAFENKCDYLELNRITQTTHRVFIFFLFSLLFAVPFSADLTDAAMEEILLFHGLKQNPISPLSHLAVEVMRCALFGRKVIVPLQATFASAAVLAKDTLSIESTVFDIVAVAFVLEADDLLPSLLLYPSCQTEMDNLVEEAKNSGASLSLLSWLMTRFMTVLNVAVLCSIVIFGESVMASIGAHLNLGSLCEHFAFKLFWFNDKAIIFSIILYSIHKASQMCKVFRFSTVCYALWNFCQNYLLYQCLSFFTEGIWILTGLAEDMRPILLASTVLYTIGCILWVMKQKRAHDYVQTE